MATCPEYLTITGSLLSFASIDCGLDEGHKPPHVGKLREVPPWKRSRFIFDSGQKATGHDRSRQVEAVGWWDEMYMTDATVEVTDFTLTWRSVGPPIDGEATRLDETLVPDEADGSLAALPGEVIRLLPKRTLNPSSNEPTMRGIEFAPATAGDSE